MDLTKQSMNGIPLSLIHPHYLHTNSTSHPWALGAIAELIDNACDPDVQASTLHIEKYELGNKPNLTFLDDGFGMNSKKLLHLLSFGFSYKRSCDRNNLRQPIGQYGNGFKSGTMRLGKDVIVFTKCKETACVGLLSQTYLQAIKAESVLVPLLEYELPTILKYSLFQTQNDLVEELKKLGTTGTKIIIYNLRRLDNGRYELDFDSDPTDIRCPEAYTARSNRADDRYNNEYRRSLRQYCKILYFRPKMKIFIRGEEVEAQVMSKSLLATTNTYYKPRSQESQVRITLGFSREDDTEDYGMMLYHRNRLIKAYERVGCQKQANERGVGVIGVAQVDFLKPTHNKQDFELDYMYNTAMSAFANKLNDYWNNKSEEYNRSVPGSSSASIKTLHERMISLFRQESPGSTGKDGQNSTLNVSYDASESNKTNEKQQKNLSKTKDFSLSISMSTRSHESSNRKRTLEVKHDVPAPKKGRSHTAVTQVTPSNTATTFKESVGRHVNKVANAKGSANETARPPPTETAASSHNITKAPPINVTTIPPINVTPSLNTSVTTAPQSNETTASQSSVTTAPQPSVTTASHTNVTTAPQSSVAAAPHTNVTLVSNTNITTAPHTNVTPASNINVTTAPHTNVTPASNINVTTAPLSNGTTASQSNVTTGPQPSVTTASHTNVTTAPQSSVAAAQHTNVTHASNTNVTTAPHTNVTPASNTNVTTAPHTNVTPASNINVTTAPLSNGTTASQSNPTTQSQSNVTQFHRNVFMFIRLFHNGENIERVEDVEEYVKNALLDFMSRGGS
ncbi:uncharacterized protein LOC131936959 [Physella acuta]|uniref:uncharacterized protein LOC131936959 n=1 Tax=Physella acuta TaxID=109671 RepID=UPI0027DD0E5D|nr:uncharacterized protein LOC131936959 [Physella acuta]